MTLFLLDSELLRLLRDKDPKVEARFAAVAEPDLVVTSVISAHESVMGWHTYLSKAKSPAAVEYGYQELARSVMSFARFAIVGYPMAAIDRFNSLVKLKIQVGKNDLRIAAIALEAGATVVTRNLRDFRRVPRLICEDWSV